VIAALALTHLLPTVSGVQLRQQVARLVRLLCGDDDLRCAVRELKAPERLLGDHFGGDPVCAEERISFLPLWHDHPIGWNASIAWSHDT
jgi:hypothetical protein